MKLSSVSRRGNGISQNSQCYPDSPNPLLWCLWSSTAIVWRKAQGLDTGVICKLLAGSTILNMSCYHSQAQSPLQWNEELNQPLPPLPLKTCPPESQHTKWIKRWLLWSEAGEGLSPSLLRLKDLFRLQVPTKHTWKTDSLHPNGAALIINAQASE